MEKILFRMLREEKVGRSRGWRGGHQSLRSWTSCGGGGGGGGVSMVLVGGWHNFKTI